MTSSSVGLRLNRRQLLVGVAGTALLAACGGGGAGGGATEDEDLRFLVPFFATGEMEPPILRTGVEQRMPWGIGDGEGIPLQADVLPPTMDMVVGREGTVVATVNAALHSEGVPSAYYALRHTFADPGRYDVTVTFDGEELTRNIQVAAPQDLALVQPGERAMPVLTPTTTDARGVDPICTRDPQCPFHELTLADALANGRPTAFLISTPLFCQTAVCGPVLELLVDEASGRPGLNVVHAEVYADAVAKGNIIGASLTEAVNAYALSFEPSLLVIDAAGMVTDRLDFVYDASELRQVLD